MRRTTIKGLALTAVLAMKIGNLEFFQHQYRLSAVFSDASGVFKGDAVKLAQQLLEDYGYSLGPIDGDFGVNTENAVKQFQTDYGLAVDGIVGPKTWAMLGS